MEKQYHIQCTPEDVAPYVLLPGDPHRVEKVAALWDEARFVADNREHVTWTGVYKGMPVTCTSTGMGCPSTAIAMEELARCGAKTFLRMGTCLGIQEEVRIGDLVIFDSACRFEGTTRHYAPIEFPAVAHHEVVEGAIQAAKRLGISYHVGTSRCIDAIYPKGPRALEDMTYGGYRLHDWEYFVQDLKAMKLVGGEMESSAVMVLSRLFGLRGGAVCMCVANMNQKDDDRQAGLDFNRIDYGPERIGQLNRIAVECMHQIWQNDQEKTRA